MLNSRCNYDTRRNLTYEVCKLAKEKGFGEMASCYQGYRKDGTLFYFSNMPDGKERVMQTDCFAPTQSLLQRWLREEKGIVVEVIAQPTRSTSKKNCYWWGVKQNSDGFCYQYEECSYLLHSDEGHFDTYELALEDAIKYALENLV